MEGCISNSLVRELLGYVGEMFDEVMLCAVLGMGTRHMVYRNG